MPEFQSDSSTNRILKNGVAVAIRFLVVTLAGILFIPFLVGHFGKSSYGLIALAGILTQYVGILASCVGSSVARFINVALNKDDWKQASEIFSTAVVSNVGLILLQLPIYAWAIWKLELIVDFPADISTDFRILVICSVLIFLISSVSGVLFTPLQAANRVDIGAQIDMYRQIIRIILLVVLILGVGAKLWIIGVVDLGLAIVRAFVGFILYRKYAHKLEFRWAYITKKWIRPVVEMAGWMVAFALGQAFFVKIDVWVVNRFVADEMAGVYAALLVWPNALRQVGNQMAVLVTPVYMIDFAKGNYERIAESCTFLFKSLSFVAALAGGALCGFSQWILYLWLGEEFVQYVPLLFVMIFYVVLTLNKAITWPIFPAFNKTKQLGITTLFCGGLNLALSIGFVFLGWGAYGVAIATLLSLFLLFGILYPWHVAAILGIRFRGFMICHVKTVVIFCFTAFPIAYIVGGSLQVGIKVAVSGLVLAGVMFSIWKVMYTNVDKQRIKLEVEKIMGKMSGLFSKT